MKTPIIFLSTLALSEFAVIVALLFGGSPISQAITDPYKYCWTFRPTADISAFELAVVIEIFGGGGGVPEPLRHYSKDPDHFFPPRPDDTDFVDGQFQRTEWCDK